MMSATDARLRHYLEQMMFIFLGARVPVKQAAEHLAEVESHCIEAGDGEPADPFEHFGDCLLYTSPSPRDKRQSRMPSSA